MPAGSPTGMLAFESVQSADEDSMIQRRLENEIKAGAQINGQVFPS